MADFFNALLATDENETINIRNVKAVYAALRSQDLEELGRLLVKEPVWDIAPGFPEGGVYRGMSGVFGEFYKKLIGRVRTLGAYPEAFLDHGNVVVALGYYRARGKTDEEASIIRFAHIWGVDNDGKIKGVWQVADSALFPGNAK